MKSATPVVRLEPAPGAGNITQVRAEIARALARVLVADYRRTHGTPEHGVENCQEQSTTAKATGAAR